MNQEQSFQDSLRSFQETQRSGNATPAGSSSFFSGFNPSRFGYTAANTSEEGENESRQGLLGSFQQRTRGLSLQLCMINVKQLTVLTLNKMHGAV